MSLLHTLSARMLNLEAAFNCHLQIEETKVSLVFIIYYFYPLTSKCFTLVSYVQVQFLSKKKSVEELLYSKKYRANLFSQFIQEFSILILKI